MLFYLLIAFLIYELFGLGFLVWSLGTGDLGKPWTWSRFIREATSDRTEWRFLICLMQAAVPIIVLSSIVWVSQRLFDIRLFDRTS